MRWMTKLFTTAVIPIVFSACSSLSQPPTGSWVLQSGSNKLEKHGSYGKIGVPSKSNIPGVRYQGMVGIDKFGRTLLFGGSGYASEGESSDLNDLWMWDGKDWIWISGNKIPNITNGTHNGTNGRYGHKGITDSANVPGARRNGASWTDLAGNFWIFGGLGFDEFDKWEVDLNDLWMWDGTTWTWKSGSSEGYASGECGVKGTAARENFPGARYWAYSWRDSLGKLWLFGGHGYGCDSSHSRGLLNDLWMWDGKMWTWVSGAKAPAEYGKSTLANEKNIPSPRYGGASWADKDGNLWLYGGTGINFLGNEVQLSDFWRWDGKKWMLVSGSDQANAQGSYVELGTPSLNNTPGARSFCNSWVDHAGNFWLWRGVGYQAQKRGKEISHSSNKPDVDPHILDELWKWNGKEWSLVFSRKVISSSTNLQQDLLDKNYPRGRESSHVWEDKNGNFQFFGGGTEMDMLNDLWMFRP